MQANPHYDNCVEEIIAFFEERIDCAVKEGVDRSKLIVDPGIGFGKRLSDNLEILSHLTEFKRLGLPIMIGASRKSFIGQLSQSAAEPSGRIGGSIAAAVVAVNNGADMVRVHDVAQTVEALKVVQGISTAG
jgi:dihydropteroate synthase